MNNMKKVTQEELAANKFYSSGLYKEPFYKEFESYFEDLNIEDVSYNRELLSQVWNEDEEDIEGEDKDEKEDRLFELVDQRFWNNLSLWNTYYMPQIFDEEVALECGLTPFTYHEMELLAPSCCGMNFTPKLPGRHPVLLRGTPIRTQHVSFQTLRSSLSKPMANMSR